MYYEYNHRFDWPQVIFVSHFYLLSKGFTVKLSAVFKFENSICKYVFVISKSHFNNKNDFDRIIKNNH